MNEKYKWQTCSQSIVIIQTAKSNKAIEEYRRCAESGLAKFQKDLNTNLFGDKS